MRELQTMDRNLVLANEAIVLTTANAPLGSAIAKFSGGALAICFGHGIDTAGVM